MFNIFHKYVESFNVQYKCYSGCTIPGKEREDFERGGRIIMPPSALEFLTLMKYVVYPMTFKLTNKKDNRVTHCGVLEFVADEGKVYLPYWMMRNLLLDEGSVVHVQYQTLPVATFTKFQLESADFIHITDPKFVLENGLKHFTCLTVGDLITITDNEKLYEFRVLETRPGSAVSILECDLNVELTPFRYIELELKPASDDESAVFPGKGYRLNVKEDRSISSEEAVNMAQPKRHIELELEPANDNKPTAFPGKGYRLKGKIGESNSSEKAVNMLQPRRQTKFQIAEDSDETGFCRLFEKSLHCCNSASQNPVSVHGTKALQDFKELFRDQRECDVTIKVQGQEFQAHKTILIARSPVFASTFRNDMKEKTSRIINIEDCDPSSFVDFLCFLYCGNIDNLSKKNVFGLFTVADKYNVEDLRSECLKFMKNNLSIDTSCDTTTELLAA